tara:strand:- start:49 stop:483 length:435 start_codon:yes stop_codon:yes gene_type:complete
MTIYLFDFDNTIVELPYKESINYMDTDDSLNPNLPFKLIIKTKEDYKQAVKNNDGPILLLSNRVVGVRKALEITLGVFGYKFDDYYLIEDEDRSKGNRLKRILKKYPDCTHIKYWEDKDKHIHSIEKTLSDYPKIVLEVIKTDI